MSASDNASPSPYLTIARAAALLGVTPGTLRNWDRQGKLPARRHPLNGYRLYARADLEWVMQPVAPPAPVRR